MYSGVICGQWVTWETFQPTLQYSYAVYDVIILLTLLRGTITDLQIAFCVAQILLSVQVVVTLYLRLLHTCINFPLPYLYIELFN